MAELPDHMIEACSQNVCPTDDERVAAAILAERGACEKIARDLAGHFRRTHEQTYSMQALSNALAAEDIADLIAARSSNSGEPS